MASRIVNSRSPGRLVAWDFPYVRTCSRAFHVTLTAVMIKDDKNTRNTRYDMKGTEDVGN